MMTFSCTFVAIITAVVITSANAFAAPKISTLHLHRSPVFPAITPKPSSSTAIHACLDGIFYESTQPEIKYDPTEMCELCLIHEKANLEIETKIFDCLVHIVGLKPLDAYEVVTISTGMAQTSLIDDFPREQAEYYYEQLIARGIPVGLWGEAKRTQITR